MTCCFETALYLDVGGYSLRGVRAEVSEGKTPTLSSWDREVLECLVHGPCVAEVVIIGVDPADLDSREGRAVLEAARRLRAAGRPFGLPDLLLELPEQNIQRMLVSIYERVAEYQVSSSDRIEHITEAMRRRAAKARAIASARAIKTSRLDVASEAALLERLVAQRRIAQGMDRFMEETSHGR